MLTISARNVEEAWALFVVKMKGSDHYVRERASRGRVVKEFIYPVTTLYKRPDECWLRDPARDANPFFHVYEALWILSGGSDVTRPAYYAKQIKEYSDDGLALPGAYGLRMRRWFGRDQLSDVIDLLARDPDTRRAVITLYDPAHDLPFGSSNSRDVPCNTTIYFKQYDGILDMTVCNRSNDAVWGCYGANAVHFSFIQQYVADALKLSIGHYHQVSDSLHVYTGSESAGVWERCLANPPALRQSYFDRDIVRTYLFHSREKFDEDLREFVADSTGRAGIERGYQTDFIKNIAVPMFTAYELHRAKETARAVQLLLSLPRYGWLVAAREWLMRRMPR